MIQASAGAAPVDHNADAGEPEHPLATYLRRLHRKHAGCTEGRVASYIPELTKADPAWFGIAVATIDGHVYEVGDTRQAFTIQSISKPFVYGLALQDQGTDEVLAKIGVEPSGDAFNSISLHRDSGRPFNPMINAGAIAATGLVRGATADQKSERIVALASRCAGRTLSIDDAVYRSERDTGFRNFAIGFMLRNFDIVESSPEPILDAYFRQCSVLVTARDLAIMAATLANGGTCPLTGEVALERRHVPRVLSVMATCGMYDYAGEWIYRIGMPSKSGVGGAIIGVLPGQMAIAVFSPPLDSRGNSVRGIRVFNDLSDDFGLHLLRGNRVATYVIRRRYDAAAVGSKRLRRAAESRALAEHGHRIVVHELQGELTIFSIERVIRELLALGRDVAYVVVDFRRVLRGDAAALELWLAFLAGAGRRFDEVVLTGLSHSGELRTRLERDVPEANDDSHSCMDDVDVALEHCEDRLLTRLGAVSTSDDGVRLEDFDVCEGLDASLVDDLRKVLEVRRYQGGDLIVHRDDSAADIFFLVSGKASVLIDLPDGGIRRLTTCTPGMLFGEMALLERRPRSADVRADGPVECLAMSQQRFEELTGTHPELKVKLLENFARRLSLRVRKLTEELRALGS
jgi:glutaminase